MKLYDISLPIQAQLPTWPGDPQVELERLASIADGSDANVSSLSSSVHMGTHVDAPLHFIDGAESVDQLDMHSLIGRVHVVDFRGLAQITAKDLQAAGISRRAKRLLFKTDNSRLWDDFSHDFYEEFVAVSPDGAEWLVERKIKLVGIDYLSIAPFHDGVPTHHILLDAGVVILEGLNLMEVAPGRYTLYCLPLNLVGSDGAPARALLTGP
jgi:arylformamidase